ncbi:MAG: leucine-rich repeat protein [Bacilli bacterium]
MNEDLKIIKKKYGEDMMHFCRENFSSLLETEGLLQTLLLEHFHPCHYLFNDIKKENLERNFKNYIYSLVDVENNDAIIVNKTPKELLSDVGYNLFECTTEEEIQSFKRYYAPGEELCTFSDDRLSSCYVFFAVKKDVGQIKREDFTNPKRQDLYGTSVISIQFTKDENHTLSIKNRYNHTVSNPDATFSNNLDNIIPGLTESFEKEYGLVQKYKNNDFEITNYTKAEGKYYKFNYEIDNIYYCPDNIIIKNFKAKQYEKEKYIIMDYFILDLVNKKITLYDDIIDSFPDTIKDIEKIKLENKEDKKEIYITEKEGEVVVITLDKENHIIGYKNNNVETIERCFLYYNELLTSVELFSVEKIGDHFMTCNKVLSEIELPKVKTIGSSFLFYNHVLSMMHLPKLEMIGSSFLNCNDALRVLNLPNLKSIGNFFLEYNQVLVSLSLPKAELIGDSFLFHNNELTELDLPKLQKAGYNFLICNDSLRSINIPEDAVIKGRFVKEHQNLFEKQKKVKQKKL